MDARGISPVIGIILMAAVVVGLAAVTGAMVLGFDTPENPPKAAFEVSVEGDEVFVQHAHGDSINPAQLTVDYGDAQRKWSAVGSPSSGQVSSGDSASVAAETTGQLALRWTAPDGEEAYTLYSTFVAPKAAVNITDVKFEDGYSGWSDQHLADEGYSPEGHVREIYTKNELQFRKGAFGSSTVTDSKGISPAPSGTTRSFTLTYDGSEFIYEVDGKTVTSSQIAVNENAIAVMAKNRDSQVTTVEVKNIRLNGQAVGTDLSVTTDKKAESIIIEADGIENGFELTGDVTYTYSGSVSNGEAIGVRIEVS